MIADYRVVSDVGISHDESVTANFRQPSAFDRSPIEGDILADFVVLANFQPRGLAFIGHVLRRHPNRTERKKNVMRADLRWPLDGYVRNQTAVLAQFNVRSDHTVRANLARCRDLGAGIDDGRGMNVQERISVEGCITTVASQVASQRPASEIPSSRAPTLSRSLVAVAVIRARISAARTVDQLA